MNDLSLQAAVVVNSEQAETAFDRVGDKAQQMANEVSTAATKAGQAVDKVGDGAGASAEKFTRAESRISASIKRATTELELLGKTASQRLEFNIADKGLDASKFEPALKKLREIEAQAMQAQRAATGSLDKMGVSAAQTAAALRGVPAQFTDIVTSLQGGQAPLTVFLQQGGQLRDMFGGAGTAARALGGYVLGLVNPFTIAAAAVAGIAVAYNQGAKEADAYRAALVTTGNAAGTNAAQLKSYAQEISSVVGTQGKAAEALSALAATGKVGAENLREAAQAAVAYERATGQAASKTAEQFAALRNEPLSAVLKLNDGMNFLTESTYRQIKSLEEQGKTAEAANVAQRAFADTLSGRAGEMERNLGTVERGWIAVKDAAKSAWDAILNVGRASTSVDQLAEVRKQIAQRENQIANGGFGTNEGGAAFGRPSQAATERLRAELAGLQAKAAALEGVAYATRVSAEEERKRGEAVKAGAAFDKAGEKYLSDKARMERELAAARVQGAEAGRSQAEIEKRLSEIRASYAKKGGGGVAAENKELRDQQRIFAELAGVSSTYYSELANYQKQRAAGVVTEDQYVAAVEKLIQKQPFAVELAKEETEANKALTKAYAEAAAERIKTIQSMERAADGLQSQNDALRDEIELIGLSTEQQTLVLEQRNDVIILTKEATLAELERQSAITGTQTRAEIALASEIEALKERNALLGAKGVKNAAVDAAKTAEDEWRKTADSINSTLTDALMRGFESGKDFAKNMRDTIINMFKTMVLRPVISAVVNPIAGAVTGALGLSGAANAATGGGVLGMASNASSAYNMVAGGGAFAGALGSGFTMGMGGLGSMGAALEGGAAMLGSATGVSSALAGIGQIAGALGPIALGIGAIVGLSKLFGAKGTQEYGGVASYSAATGVQTSSTHGAFGTGFGGVAANEQILGNVSGIAQSIVTALDATAKTFGQTVGYEAAAGFASDFGKEATWGGLRIALQGMDLVNWDATRESRWAPREFDSGEEGYKQYLAEIAQDTRKVLLDMDLPTWADEIITSIGDAASMDQLSAALQQIGAIQTTFTNLGKAIEGFAGMTDSAFTALMRASGGIEALSANAGTYYENFYSEAEKTATVTRSVSDALAAVGLQMPATRDEFRALVESQIALGEGGTQAVAALLGVSGAFASVVPAAADAASAVEEMVSQIMQNLLRDRGRLEADLLRAQGNTAGADAANRLIDIAGYTEEEIALYDYNAALRAQISGLEAASAASANALQRIREQAEAARQSAIAEVDNAYAALQRSVDAQRSLVQETINDTRAVFETLRDNVRSLYGEVGGTAAMQAAQGRAFIGQALSAAQATGYLPDGQKLQDAIGAVRSEMQSKVYASQAESDYERLVLAGELKDLKDLSGDQLTEAEKQLKALDDILDNARSQVDALKGIDTSVMSVEAAIQRLADALLEAKNPGLMDKYGMSAERLRELQGTYGDSINSAAGGTQYDKYKMYSAMLQDAAVGSVTFDEMRAVVESIAGAQTDADWKYLQQGSAGVEYAYSIMPAIQETSAENKAGWYNNLAGVGLTDAQIREMVEAQLGAQTPEDWDYLKKLAGVPAFAVGTNYVPRDMLAQIHEGEAIVPKAYNPAAGGAGSSNARLEALVEGLTKEVQRLQAVVNDGNREQRRTANAVNGNPDMPMLVQTV